LQTLCGAASSAGAVQIWYIDQDLQIEIAAGDTCSVEERRAGLANVSVPSALTVLPTPSRRRHAFLEKME